MTTLPQAQKLTVPTSAASKLMEYLASVDRLGLMDLQAVQRAINAATGDGVVKGRYEELSNGSYLVDVSNGFGGVELYAVIRRGENGMEVEQVLDIDRADALRMGQSVTSDADAQERQLQELKRVANEETQPRRAPVAPAPVQATVDPGSPVLVLAWKGEPGANMEFPPDEMAKTTQGEIPAVMSKLIQEGYESSRIEVWTGLRRPKIRVDLE